MYNRLVSAHCKLLLFGTTGTIRWADVQRRRTMRTLRAAYKVVTFQSRLHMIHITRSGRSDYRRDEHKVLSQGANMKYGFRNCTGERSQQQQGVLNTRRAIHLAGFESRCLGPPETAAYLA